MPESDVTLEIVEETAITIELVETGARGVGVPAGGTTGQVLKKTSNADYAADWEDEQGGGVVDSVFGRTDAVVAEAGDYNEAQIAIEDAQVYEDLTAGSVTGTTVKELLVSLITGFSATITTILSFMTTKAFDKTVDDLDDINAGTTNKHFTQTEKTKLAGIESGAEQNNISDVSATDLTDGGDTTLHMHDGRYYTESETDALLANKQNNLGYTAENAANKDIDGTLAANSDAKYASQKATKTYADTKLPISYLDTDGALAANSDTKIASQKAIVTYAKKRTGQGTGKVDGFSVRDYRILGNAYLNGVTSVTPSTNRWTFEFYDVTEPITLDRVGIEVTTAGAAGKLVRLALYTADQYLQPGTLVQDFGTVATDVGAVPTFQTIAINLTLQPGRYIGIVTQDGAAAFRVMTGFHLAGNALTAGTGAAPYRNIASLGGAGTVSGGYASVSPKWERDVYSGSAAGQYIMKFREAV